MDPATLTLVIQLVVELAKNVPNIVEKIQEMKAKGDPTAADWAELKATLESELQYRKLIPATKLPVSELDEQDPKAS